MSDLIDRQEAIEHCKKRLFESAFNNTMAVCDVSYIMQEIADNRIDIWLKELPSAHRWIPVSEKLPEMFHDVLISTRWETVDRAYRSFTCWLHNGMDYTNYENDEILAWMPLPEPWKGEEE